MPLLNSTATEMLINGQNSLLQYRSTQIAREKTPFSIDLSSLSEKGHSLSPLIFIWEVVDEWKSSSWSLHQFLLHSETSTYLHIISGYSWVRIIKIPFMILVLHSWEHSTTIYKCCSGDCLHGQRISGSLYFISILN